MLTLIHEITFLIYSKFVNEGAGFFDIVNVVCVWTLWDIPEVPNLKTKN